MLFSALGTTRSSLLSICSFINSFRDIQIHINSTRKREDISCTKQTKGKRSFFPSMSSLGYCQGDSEEALVSEIQDEAQPREFTRVRCSAWFGMARVDFRLSAATTDAIISTRTGLLSPSVCSFQPCLMPPSSIITFAQLHHHLAQVQVVRNIRFSVLPGNREPEVVRPGVLANDPRLVPTAPLLGHFVR